MGARTTAADSQAAAPTQKKRTQKKDSKAQDFVQELAAKGKNMTTVGGIITAVAACITLLCVSDALFWLP